MAGFINDLEDTDTLDADEIIPRFYVGSAWYTSGMLLHHGVTHVLNVSADMKPDFEVTSKLDYLYIPLKDEITSNIVDYFPLCIQYIDLVLEKQSSKLLVHCTAGVSRSVAIICAYLMFKLPHQYALPQDAIKKVKSHRLVADPNPGFIRQLDVWKECNFNISDPKIERNAWRLDNSPVEILFYHRSTKKTKLRSVLKKNSLVKCLKVK